MGFNSEIQGYNFYPMLHFRRKFSSSVTMSHMFTSREHFVTYMESSNGFVTVSGHNKVPVVGRGSVLFSTKLPSGWLSITL